MACRLDGAKPLSEPMLEYSVNWALRNKLQWHLNRNSNILFTKMCLKVSSAKWRPFCLGLHVLTEDTKISDEQVWSDQTLLSKSTCEKLITVDSWANQNDALSPMALCGWSLCKTSKNFWNTCGEIKTWWANLHVTKLTTGADKTKAVKINLQLYFFFFLHSEKIHFLLFLSKHTLTITKMYTTEMQWMAPPSLGKWN